MPQVPRVRGGLGLAPTALLAACAGPQSVLDPRGPVAAEIATLWWVLLGGALLIHALVMGALLYAVFRDPARRARIPHMPLLIGAGIVGPATVLVALLVYGTDVGRRISAPGADPLHIEVTGHRWWWEVRYPPTAGSPELITANELRLPVDVPVELSIRSADVVHSFWIPNLGGKVDMIPGRTNTLRLRAAEAGAWRAQCSEFCGSGHAHMGFIATAESPARFAAWRRARAAQADPGPGLELFMARGCDTCHTIAGTAARGSGGPVLTHLAARPTLGAMTVANDAAALRAWLRDHGRTLKPGSRGPERRRLDADTVEALATFLERLQ